MNINKYGNGTKCVSAGYSAKNGDPVELPIYQSTTFKYDSAEHVAKLFDFTEFGHFYSRLSNPTVEQLENKIAELEGGVGAICLSSGQSASLFSIVNIAGAGDHFLCSSALYGGTYNLFAVTMKQFGIEASFFDQDDEDVEIQKLIKPNTKAIFAESLANPALKVLDIERFAKLAHKNGIPLIIDNTFPTPYLCRPFEYGADIIVHSTTKYLDGHATCVGGAVVDSGRFDWKNGKFQGLCVPDNSYHGLIYTEHFGKAAFIAKCRAHLIRDLGCCMSPMNAFLTNLGIETMHLRMDRHSENALAVATFLEASDKVSWVEYPGLANNRYYELAKKYLPHGCSGVISLGVKGGRSAAEAFMNRLTLTTIAVHVADVRTHVLHPAGSTHRQLSDSQLLEAGVNPEMVRLSVGIEDVVDIIEDLRVALG
ncbi:MAG: PLP-dependent transferase [Synergistaceae bacterium]|nr:PLP-dependent transferase [Synergistaceae bacterium]